MRALGQILLAAAVAERREVDCARAAKIPNVPSLLTLPLPKMKQKTPNPTGLSLQIILNSLMKCSRIVLCRTAANKLARSNILRAYLLACVDSGEYSPPVSSRSNTQARFVKDVFLDFRIIRHLSKHLHTVNTHLQERQTGNGKGQLTTWQASMHAMKFLHLR